jgi:CRP-like cAMP-binding protein
MASAIERLERVEFKAGDILFNEGELSYHFYMIEEGEVEIILKNPDNPTQGVRLATLGPGQPVGESALISRKARSAMARAKSRCRLVKISEEGYEELLKELPPWSLGLMESLIERLRTTDEKVRKSQFKDEVSKLTILNVIGSNSKL